MYSKTRFESETNEIDLARPEQSSLHSSQNQASSEAIFVHLGEPILVGDRDQDSQEKHNEQLGV